MRGLRSTWLAPLAAVLGALTLAGVAGCNLNGPNPAPTVQGWTQADRDAWYNADQGSRLIPLPWLQALEQPAGGAGAAPAMFLDNTYLAGFRILPPAPGSKAGLPVGFAVDEADDSAFEKTKLRWFGGQTGGGQWVGLNCAACHTAELSYQGQSVVVDGAPSLFDFQSFNEALDQALIQTASSAQPAADSGRWTRFAQHVLAGKDSPANRALLLQALNQLIGWEQQTATLNATDLRYGYGRVDAIGHIFNRILLFGGAPQTSPNAPVSYPHLWNITKETHLQWDGIAANAKLPVNLNPFGPATPFDYGALGRNTGEVLGVFGEVVIKPVSNSLAGFASSVDVVNLNEMEAELARLQPPKWRADLFGQPGAIDVAGPSGQKLTPDQVVAAGGTLFTAHCSSCHTPQATYETLRTFAQAGSANLTDEWMACNTWADVGASGRLAGIPADYVSGDALTANEPVRALLETSVKGAMIGKKGELAHTALNSIFGITPLPTVIIPHAHFLVAAKQARLNLCMANAADPLMAYKARPLEGIWATGPFLHNGSVPTLYDLLSPPAARPKTFQMGTRAFDPRHVGFAVDAASPGNSFTYDTSLPGNSNKGHDYGASSFSETERLELLEYLKTL
jgi:mono/diheme cytochrome c family protein